MTTVVTDEMVEAGARKVAEMCGHDEEPRGWDKDVARNVYLAMSTASQPPAEDAVERVDLALHHLQADGALDRAMLAETLRAVRAALQAIEIDEGLFGRLKEWALDKSTLHHRLAHENEDLRTEHIASSTAYRNLADELEALSSGEMNACGPTTLDIPTKEQ